MNTPEHGDRIETLITEWVRPEIRALKAYPVPDAAGLVKLDAMENPYPPPSQLAALWNQQMLELVPNRYPDPEAKGLRQRLRKHYGIGEQHELLFGNGSDELIQILALALAGPGRTILAVEPSFVMYRMTAVFTQTAYQGVPLRADFSLDLGALREAMRRHQPVLTFIAQPNNPTGNLFAPQNLELIVRESPGLVIIDEAYGPFTDSDCLPWLDQYPNVLIMRTLSKVGLAGFRFGVLIGNRQWINELNKVRMPYNINSATQMAIATALDHFEPYRRQCAEIRKERSRLAQALEALEAGTVYPSEANFILLRLHPGRDAGQVQRAMIEQGVLVKSLQGADPLLDRCLRLTVGTPEESEQMLKALKTALAERS